MRIPHPEGGLVGIHGWDGSSWRRILSDVNGRVYIILSDPQKGLVGAHAWDGLNWRKISSDANGMVYVTFSDPQKGLVGAHAWDGASWRKISSDANGRVQVTHSGVATFRFKESIVRRLTATSTGTEYTMYGDTVPAGEYWVITQTSTWNITRDTLGAVLIYVEKDTVVAELTRVAAPKALEMVTWSGELILQAGQRLRWYHSGIQAGDALRYVYFGYKIEV